jgi:hypothetical protein
MMMMIMMMNMMTMKIVLTTKTDTQMTEMPLVSQHPKEPFSSHSTVGEICYNMKNAIKITHR